MCQKAPTKKTRTRPKIICITIAAVLIAVIGYFSGPSFWFWICWVFGGAGLVAIGCVGEWALFIKLLPEDSDDQLKSHHRRRELQFITAVAIGVTMDFIGLFHEIPQALQLEKEVVLIGSTNAQLVAGNLVLRSNVVSLEAAVQWRTISPAQEAAITNFLMPRVSSGIGLSKDITFTVDSSDAEALAYSKRISGVLSKCGFVVGGFVVQTLPNSPGDFKFEVPQGLQLVVKDWNKRPPFLDVVYEAFKSSGMNPELRTGPVAFQTDQNIMILVLHKPEQ